MSLWRISSASAALLSLLAASVAADEDAEAAEESETKAPYRVSLPPADTGLPEDILDRMRARLVEQAESGKGRGGESQE